MDATQVPSRIDRWIWGLGYGDIWDWNSRHGAAALVALGRERGGMRLYRAIGMQRAAFQLIHGRLAALAAEETHFVESGSRLEVFQWLETRHVGVGIC